MAVNSKQVTDLINAPADWVTWGVSSSFGAAVKGDRISVALAHKARGTGSRPHYHLNEQFNFVLRGTLMGMVGGEPFRCPKGSVVHIPAKTPHSIIADPNDEDVIFYVVKDTAAGIGEGFAVDGQLTGPRTEEGFQFDPNIDHNRDFR